MGGVTIHITGNRKMYHLPDALKQKVSNAIQPLLEDWANLPRGSMVPTSLYGIRMYMEGSTLDAHVDVLKTHVLSAVYVVDVKNLEEPWWMELEPDFAGQDVKLDLQPGQLMLYESAKLAHGRPSVLTGKGSHYASMFVHFRPSDWPMQNEDRVYAVHPKVLAQSWEGAKDDL